MHHLPFFNEKVLPVEIGKVFSASDLKTYFDWQEVTEYEVPTKTTTTTIATKKTITATQENSNSNILFKLTYFLKWVLSIINYTKVNYIESPNDAPKILEFISNSISALKPAEHSIVVSILKVRNKHKFSLLFFTYSIRLLFGFVQFCYIIMFITIVQSLYCLSFSSKIAFSTFLCSGCKHTP